MDIEQTLRMACVPLEPAADFEDAVMARVSRAAKSVRGARRKTSRIILFGTVLAIAAAAAMLAARQKIPASPVAIATPISDPKPVEVVAAATPSLTARPELQPLEEKSELKEVAVKPFVVRVLPLQNEAKDAAARDAIASMYAAFLDRLRTVPGLTLLEPDQGGSALEAPPEIRITIRGAGASASDQYPGEMQAETLRPDGTTTGTTYIAFSGDVAPRCRSALPVDGVGVNTSSCTDPQGVAANLVGRLRTMIFPPDPSVRRQLQARLLDRSLDATQRLRALTSLASLERGRPGVARTSGPKAIEALRDPAVVHGAIDLATNAADPMLRAQVWAMLRGVGNAELMRPLLTALRQDVHSDVRLAALGTLAADFREDARFHPALEAAAQHDARPLVRVLALRALGGSEGETAWRNYISASLKDARHPAIERIEALFYQLGLPVTAALDAGASSSPTPRSTLRSLDDEAIRALVEVLPEAAAQSSIVLRSAARVVTELGHIDHPAITDMLLAYLDDGSHWLSRETSMEALAALPGRRSDPRVRAMFEKVSANDPNPELRRIAAASLQDETPAAVAARAGTPPRLGVMLMTLEFGPEAPPEERVGTAIVKEVGPDTVAEKAGLLPGDVLLEINGTRVAAASDTPRILESVPRGVDVDVLVLRSGKKVTLKAQF